MAGFLSNGWHGEGRRPSAIQPSGPAGLRNLPLMNNLRIGQDQGAAGPPAGPPAGPASRPGPLVRIDALEVVVVAAVERGAELASHLAGARKRRVQGKGVSVHVHVRRRLIIKKKQ